jgi:hypothetical protein
MLLPVAGWNELGQSNTLIARSFRLRGLAHRISPVVPLLSPEVKKSARPARA